MSYAPTPRQLDLLRFIEGYQRHHGGVSPSLSEMRDGLGLAHPSRSTIHHMLVVLERRGLVRRLPNRERAIELLWHPPIPRAPDGAPLFAVAGVA